MHVFFYRIGSVVRGGVHVDRQYLGPKPEGVHSGPAKHVTILRTFVPICSVTRVDDEYVASIRL
jgi:hypothetical protein